MVFLSFSLAPNVFHFSKHARYRSEFSWSASLGFNFHHVWNPVTNFDMLSHQFAAKTKQTFDGEYTIHVLRTFSAFG
jgi:hypothetical protein